MNPDQDQVFADMVAEHAPRMVTKEVVDMMYMLRDLLRERVRVTGNGIGLGKADVSCEVNGRDIWIFIEDRTPETAN